MSSERYRRYCHFFLAAPHLNIFNADQITVRVLGCHYLSIFQSKIKASCGYFICFCHSSVTRLGCSNGIVSRHHYQAIPTKITCHNRTKAIDTPIITAITLAKISDLCSLKWHLCVPVCDKTVKGSCTGGTSGEWTKNDHGTEQQNQTWYFHFVPPCFLKVRIKEEQRHPVETLTVKINRRY